MRLALALLAACAPVAAAPPDADAGPDASLPRLHERISQTGLYADVASKRVAPDLLEFAPAHVLWSDGATKRRWLRLPRGTTIDTSDMDHWRFPIGTQLFKEFVRDGVLVETRLIEHVADTGNAEKDYWVGSFVWRADESDADFTLDGASDVRGTDHDAPAQKQCWACHLGTPGHVLGFSAVQLSKPGPGVTLASLAAQRLMSAPPGADFAPPGDATTAAALGYLHANCGHCHNPNGLSWPDTDMNLYLSVAERTPTDTAAYKSAVGAPLTRFQSAAASYRVVPGNPDASAIVLRMESRADHVAMPPLASEHVDAAGAALVRAWIRSL